MSKFFYAPEGGEGSGGGAGSSAGSAAGGAGSNAGAGSQGGGTLLGGGASSSGGGAGNAPPPSGQQPGTPPLGGGAPVVTKSFREGWIGADGKIDKSAYDRLPENLKPWKDTFSKYETDEALLSAFAHSVSLNGKKGLMALPKDASDADKKVWNERLGELLGVPKEVAGYGVLEKPKDVPDALWNGEYVQTMAGIMHRYNAPPDMVRELFAADQKFGTSTMGKSQAQVQQARQQAETEISTAFGTNRDAEITGAKRAAETLGLDVNDPSIGNNPKVIIALSKVAKLLGEDKLVKGGGEQGVGGGGDDRARARDIVMNKANPLYEAYHDAGHGGHKQAVAQYEALVQNWNRRQRPAA